MPTHYLRLFLIGVIGLAFHLFAPALMAQGIGMVTGSTTGTYIQFGRDIADVARAKGVEIIVKESEGSLDNIKRLRSKENAALAIVQSDLLGFLNRSENPTMQGYSKDLKLIFPFYNEEVHLLASKTIRQFEDLDGKRVVVGTKGSGTYLTSNNLLYMLDIKPAQRITDLPPAKAVKAVLMGKADAMFYVAGKPVTLFQNISRLLDEDNPAYTELVDKIHFVPLDHEKMRQEYTFSTIEPRDYKWVHETVFTIAVKAALVCYDFSQDNSPYFRKRCRQLAKIGQAVRDSIDHLKQNGHSKWKQVKLNEDIGIWEWDTCSRMEPSPDTDESKEEFEQKLEDFLNQPYEP